jgi:hypothetical protein
MICPRSAVYQNFAHLISDHAFKVTVHCRVTFLVMGLCRNTCPLLMQMSFDEKRRREVKYSFWLLNLHHHHVNILTGQFAKGIPTALVTAVAV